jgi:hypothetical protein
MVIIIFWEMIIIIVTAVETSNLKQRNGVSFAARADGCGRNNGIRHALAKQQRNGIFYAVRAKML